MRTAALAALASFPLALMVAGAAACGSSGSASAGSSGTNAGTHVLHGAYVPVATAGSTNGSSAASAEFRALVFYSDTGYFSYANNCTGASCRSQGSYVFDGKSDLALTDGTTHATRHLDFQAVKSETTGAVGLVGDIVMAPSTTIVDAGPNGASLLSQIIQALLDGILMALLGAGSDGGAGSGAYCDPIAAAIDCGLQGLSVQSSSDGSCSCGSSTPADAGDASVTISIPVSTPTPTAATPQTIPLAVNNASATVQLSLGGGAPVTALLDTGSSGIWVRPGVIPAAGGTRSTTTLSQTYGAKVTVSGTVTTTAVTLGNVASSMPLAVAEVTSTACVAGATCPADVGGDPTQFLFAQQYPAIVGIGLRHPNAAGVNSPMPYLGQNGQHIVSLGSPGATTGAIIVDPSDDVVASFDDEAIALDPGANGGFDDTAIPFCFNSFCGTALFDCGESQGILLASTADDFANLGVPAGSTTVPASTLVDIQVVGLDFGLTVGATPQDGVDSFRIQATGVSNNLGIVAFRYFDFFYDDVDGIIGVAPKQ